MSNQKSDGDDNGADVIELKPDPNRPRVSRKPRGPGCHHDRFDLDERLRVVLCRDCGKQCDPFQVLLDVTVHWDGVYHEHKRRRNQLADLVDQIEALRRERNNLKAKVRRAGS